MRKVGTIVFGVFLLAALPLRAEYRIDVVGDQSYHSRAKPVDRGKMFVFTDLNGTLVSIKKSDVLAVHEEKPAQKKPAPDVRKWRIAPRVVSGSRPQTGARSEESRSNPVTPPRRQDVQGEAAPSAPDQLQYGRSLAEPPSGSVQVGVPTPMYQPPPPPPPPPPSA